jgi:hypothetical protein
MVETTARHFRQESLMADELTNALYDLKMFARPLPFSNRHTVRSLGRRCHANMGPLIIR